MVKCIFEEFLPNEVKYLSLRKDGDGKTLTKAAGMWKEDRKVAQRRILKLKTSWDTKLAHHSELCPS